MRGRTTLTATVLVALLCSRSTGLDIRSKEDFMTFARKVSFGNSYKDKTIYLHDDLDLAGEVYEGMGNFLDDGTLNSFQGTFNGQGHTISNLYIETSNAVAGLFGCVSAGAVENVVLDNTCIIASINTKMEGTYVGGLIGITASNYGSISIKNNVNMANIIVYENDYPLFGGGIAGALLFSRYEIEVTNCINMGSLSYVNPRGYKENPEDTFAYIGGITGFLQGGITPVSIINCLNLGSVKVFNVTKTIFVAGITGVSNLGYVSNCVNMGTFEPNPVEIIYHTYGDDIVSGILGSQFINCYSAVTTGETTFDNPDFINCRYFDSDFTLYEETSFDGYKGDSLIDALNKYVELYNYIDLSRWALNKNEKSVLFFPSSNNKKCIEFTSGIILFPGITDKENHHFYGWYNDAKFTSEFTANEIDKDTKLYGKYDTHETKYTLTFDTESKIEIKPMSVSFGEVVQLPKGEAEGNRKIGQWRFHAINDFEQVDWNFTMPAHDITLRAFWIDTVIKTPEDLKNFSENVNSGIDYSGFTVTLENDLDMGGIVMNQIGGAGSSFGGTFDGKGHAIRNMFLNSTDLNTQVVGLFGYSDIGMTIRNLIIDDSCTIISIYKPTGLSGSNLIEVYVGGIVGYCNAKESICSLENSVNMGKIDFYGDDPDKHMFVGGLVGGFIGLDTYTEIKNSMFLGTVHSELTCINGFIGGITGYIQGSPSIRTCKVVNCLNAGTLIFDGTAETFYAGGIVGASGENIAIENCVDIGSFEEPLAENFTEGRIAGYAVSITIKNCYWTDMESIPAYGKKENSEISGSSEFNKNLNLKDAVSTETYSGFSLVLALNAYALEGNELSLWAGNSGEMNVSFIVDNHNFFSTSLGIVLLPSFVSDGEKHFFGWFNDSETKTLFTESYLSGETNLYGVWRDAKPKYKATFRSEGRTVKEIEFAHGDVLKTSAVNPQRTGYTFVSWIDEYKKKVDEKYVMPKRDLALTAVWIKEEIHTKEDLREFSNAVKSGVDCKGRIIRLKGDIDMKDVADFEPIGSSDYPFKGTFEGQGFRIKNLKIKTTAQYSGLFGNAVSATVRNLILDESCSIESEYLSGYGCIGGVIGYCSAEEANCTIVNVVNYASVTFAGEISADTINIGGVVGLCKGYGSTCIINNCANHGEVTQKGSTNSTWIGGLIGRCKRYTDDTLCRVWNSINYGKVSLIGKAANISGVGVGGIMGSCDDFTEVGGCVSAGDVYVENIRIPEIGSVIGNKAESCTAAENLWFGRLNYSDTTGKNPEIGEDFTVENGRSVLEVLKSYQSSRELPETKDTRGYKTTWVVNPQNAKVTAKVNDRVIDAQDGSIVLLPTFLDGNKLRFDGWYNGDEKVETSEIRQDTTFAGKWEEEIKKKNTTTIIIIVVVVVVVLAALISSSAIYAIGYRRRKNEMVLLKELLYPEVFDDNEPENSLNRMKGLYPDDYTSHGDVKLREALRLAGLDEKQTSKVMVQCYDNARRLGEEDKLPKNLTVDDAAALAMYTFDFGMNELYHLNPYRIINSALNKRTEKNMEKAKDLIYLVMKALRKLPVEHGMELHRGIRVDVSENTNQSGGNSFPSYTEGSIITWDALSSTSPDMTVTKTFLAGGAKTGKAAGTLFIINNGWGYDIQPYSLFPTESEILLEPERKFRVTSVIPAELTIIKLEMLKTPVILPDIYGRHNFYVSPVYFIKENVYKYEKYKRRKLREEQIEYKKEKRKKGRKKKGDSEESDNSFMDSDEDVEMDEIDGKSPNLSRGNIMMD